MSAQIEARGLYKTYGANQVQAVAGVSFGVERGQILGLLGPNGAGKTTTVKILLGLVEPDAGSALIAGHDVKKQRAAALSQVGAILEGARNIYWRLSARKNLEYFGTLRGLTGAHLRSRIAEVLDLVEMASRADEETRYLSRGMQQRIALAMALLHDPLVLLLDEPTLGLDVRASRTIEEVVRKQAAMGKSILLTTHQMDLAQKLCDRIVVINKGQIVTQGTTQEVVNYFGDQQQTILIRLEGLLPADLSDQITARYPEMAVSANETHTELAWSKPGLSQPELLAFLGEIDAMGLVLRQVGRREATLGEVFVRLTSEEGE